MAGKKQDDQLEHTFSSYVMIRNVALKTYLRRWMIGRGGERGSGISVLVARHDDDEEEEENCDYETIIDETIINDCIVPWNHKIVLKSDISYHIIVCKQPKKQTRRK